MDATHSAEGGAVSGGEGVYECEASGRGEALSRAAEAEHTHKRHGQHGSRGPDPCQDDLPQQPHQQQQQQQQQQGQQQPPPQPVSDREHGPLWAEGGRGCAGVSVASPAATDTATAAPGTQRGSNSSRAESAVVAVAAVEAEAVAAAASISALLGGLKTYLDSVTSNTVAHVEVERDAAGLLQTAALEAASRGNKLVNAYLRLHEELRGLPVLCAKVKLLRQRLDTFEVHVNRFLPR